MSFAHLHVHTEFSLLDGSAKVAELVLRCAELGMGAMAVTDHGVMFGCIDFYKAAVSAGVKPILGCEVYVAPGSRHERGNANEGAYYHLVLLCETVEGYHNLVKLVSRGFTEGFYYKPRIDVEILREYNKGLIALSGCLAGPVARNFLNVGYAGALKEALLYDEIMGRGNFYLELQDHGMADQKRANQALIKISNDTGIPLVCTNDVHYVYDSDAKPHEILLCIQTGKTMNDSDRMVYEGEQFYLKSPDEMERLFAHVPQAVQNTVEIAGRCNVEIVFNEYKLPKFEVAGSAGFSPHSPPGRRALKGAPGNNTHAAYLEQLCREGLIERYGEITPEIEDRLLFELETISNMGFTDYFLITWDFIKFAHDNGIAVGPGRGSAAGSIVTYALRITNVDPLKFDLLFERFLNPDRISMPDIDIDFCYERRQEVIDYVVGKYGKEHVAQIITFGTMLAKGVIRDAGRALGYPYAECDRIAKMIPGMLGVTIDNALEMNSELRRDYNENERTSYLIDMAKRLEGLTRHASTHAAGVVVTEKPVNEYVPLYKTDDVISTQYGMNTLEELGLLKMDFLGLRTLTVIKHTCEEIKRRHGVDIDIDNLDLADPKVFEIVAAAKTEGVFQLESSGMKSFMKELKPLRIDDWIAGIALYRPGPMDFIPQYIRGKNNKNSVKYRHPSLEPILKDTYGCIVYQEQVMQIVRDLAGYNYARSDLMRRAMSKKKADVMEAERKNFIHGGEGVPGCVANGIPADVANKIFDEMTDFANYAFNKSHAAAYAIVGYQTAWLKTYYKTEFMAALMTSVMDWSGKVAEYIAECKKMGIKILPPDINESIGRFSVSGENIRFGLNAVKNVGKGFIEAVVKERENTLAAKNTKDTKKGGKFVSLTEFISRLDGKDLNKRCVESLIKAGAFDGLGGRRSQYTFVYDKVMSGVSNNKKRNIEGQLSLFESVGEQTDAYADDLPDVAEFPKNKLLADEKEVLGVYVSGHPVSEYEDVLARVITNTSLDFAYEGGEGRKTVADGEFVTIGGIIAGKSVKYTKNNEAMAFVAVEDMFGTIETVIFPKVYEKHSHEIVDGKAVVIKGKAQAKEEQDAVIICNELKFINSGEVVNRTPQNKLWLKVAKNGGVGYNQITSVLERYSGATPVVLYDERTDERKVVNERFWVNVCDDALAELKGLLGERCVVLK